MESEYKPHHQRAQGLARWLREVQSVLLGLLVLAAGLYCVVLYPRLYAMLRSVHYNDFGKFYHSALEWTLTGELYGPNAATLIPFSPTRAEQFWNMNPPHFHALIWPLTFLSLEAAHAIWTVVNLAALGAALIAIAQKVPIRASAWAWISGCVLAAASEPALSWFVTGQLTGLITAAVTWIWLDLRSERWTRAAVVAGVVTSVKPFLAPLCLFFVLRRQWRAAVVSAVTLVVAFSAGLLIFGVQAHRDWLAALGDAQWSGAVMNASGYGIVSRTWSADAFVREALPKTIGAGVAVFVLCAGIVAARRTSDTDRRVLVLLSTSLLSSPLGWVYYLPILLGPALALRSRGRITRWLYLALPGLFVPHLILFPYPSRMFALTLGSIYSWSLCYLWATAAAFGTATPTVERLAHRQKG